MKRIILFVGLSFLFLAGPAFATPPSKVDILYNKDTKILSSIVTHHTINSYFHYISKVEISVNEKIVKVERMTRQTNSNQQILSTPLQDVNPGDVISVMAYCDFFGQKGSSIKVAP
jgi:hypothetical protein